MYKLTMLGLLPAALVMGCASEDGSYDDADSRLGVATLTLVDIPTNVRCLEFHIDGMQSITERRTVTPGQVVRERLTNLPTGQVTFSGVAYPVACPAMGEPLPADTPTTWAAVPETVLLQPGANPVVELSFERTSQADVDVVATFDDPECVPVALSYRSVAADSGMFASPEHPVAQTFTPETDMRVDSVVLPLVECKANGLANARLSITATDADGQPDPASALQVATVPGDSIADSCVGGDNFAPITFTFSGVQLTAGTRYALILEGTDTVGGGVYWRRSSLPQDPWDPYSEGTIYDLPSWSDGWVAYTHLDLNFEIAGDACP